MKKLAIIFCLLLIFTGCKKEKTHDEVMQIVDKILEETEKEQKIYGETVAITIEQLREGIAKADDEDKILFSAYLTLNTTFCEYLDVVNASDEDIESCKADIFMRTSYVKGCYQLKNKDISGRCLQFIARIRLDPDLCKKISQEPISEECLAQVNDQIMLSKGMDFHLDEGEAANMPEFFQVWEKNLRGDKIVYWAKNFDIKYINESNYWNTKIVIEFKDGHEASFKPNQRSAGIITINVCKSGDPSCGNVTWAYKTQENKVLIYCPYNLEVCKAAKKAQDNNEPIVYVESLK